MQKYIKEVAINKINKNFSADRGDVRKVIKIPQIKTDIETQMSDLSLGGRGDESELKPDKPARSLSPALTCSFYREPYNESRLFRKRSPNNIKEEKVITPLTIDRRREIARKYTFKGRCEDPTNEVKKAKSTKEHSPGRDNRNCMRVEMDADHLPQRSERRRKPVIKTLTHKGDSVKMYKEVSFEENKKNVPLRLVLPAKIRQAPRNRTASSEDFDRTSQSGVSRLSSHIRVAVKKKQQEQKHSCPIWSPLSKNDSRNNIQKFPSRKKPKNRGRRRRITSPEAKTSPIPFTEIAKWNPAIINEYTKPYYEAWVNTTLSAVSRNTDPKMVMEKQQIIKQFRQVLENPPPVSTPEDISDERFTGKIRIRRKE